MNSFHVKNMDSVLRGIVGTKSFYFPCEVFFQSHFPEQVGQGSKLMPADSLQALSLSLIYRGLTPLSKHRVLIKRNRTIFITTVLLLFKIFCPSQPFSEQKITENCTTSHNFFGYFSIFTFPFHTF